MDYQLESIQNLYFKFGIKFCYNFGHWSKMESTVDFWQPLHRHAAAAIYYFSKSSQGPSLDCLASRGDPVFLYLTKLKYILWEFGRNSKQTGSPRAGNPGNVLLTSKNSLKYFYQF